MPPSEEQAAPEVQAPAVELASTEQGIIPLPAKQPKKKKMHGMSYEVSPQVRGRGGFLKLLGCVSLLAIAGLACSAVMIVNFSGRIIKHSSELPADLPQNINIYQAGEAKIEIEGPEQKAQVRLLAESLPDWLTTLLAGMFSTDLRTESMAIFRSPDAAIAAVDAKSLLASLENEINQKNKTVYLHWSKMPKQRAEILEYYQHELKARGYLVQTKTDGLYSDLTFYQTGVRGAISITDDFVSKGSSEVKMILNY